MNIGTLMLFIAHELERSLELKQITYFKHVVGIWPKARLKKKKKDIPVAACKRKKNWIAIIDILMVQIHEWMNIAN